MFQALFCLGKEAAKAECGSKEDAWHQIFLRTTETQLQRNCKVRRAILP